RYPGDRGRGGYVPERRRFGRGPARCRRSCARCRADAGCGRSVVLKLRGAVSLSTALHVGAYLGVAFLCRHQRSPGGLPQTLQALATEPLLEEPLDVDVLAPLPPELPAPLLREGDGTRSAQRDEAPTRLPGREPRAVAAASGRGAGVRETLEWTGR